MTNDLVAARALLGATWGQSDVRFDRVIGDLTHAPQPPDLPVLLSALEESPEIARWNTQVSEREARLALERARRVPVVTASIGARHYADTDDVGMVAGISAPIPFFDKNRGNIVEAQHRVAQARAEQRAARVTVRSQVEAAHAELGATFAAVVALRDRIIPRASRVFEETRRGYATGLFRFVEVLDAQRTLFEARREVLDALTLYHVVATDIERLTARPLDPSHDTRRP